MSRQRFDRKWPGLGSVLRVWPGLGSVLCVVLAGCASTRVPLTHELRQRYQLSSDELRLLQYYNSHTITLRRELASQSKQVSPGHKLIVTAGRTVEEVVIEAGTPGVALEVGPSHIVVSFAEGTALTFALEGAPLPAAVDLAAGPQRDEPNPFPGSVLSRTESWPGQGLYWLQGRQPGAVQFAGQWFDVVRESLGAHLLIDADAVDEEEEEKKVLPGVRLRS